jgi:oligoribonuclease
MHTESGLIEEIPNGVSVAEAEYEVLEYVLKHVPEEQKAPLAGNSIGTDRAFLAKYMPRLDSHLHYRNVDVSSIKELAKRWFPRAYFNSPAKNGGHRALADILESIRELNYYRRAIFVPDPGPSSHDLQAIAAAVVDEFDAKV